MSTGKNVKRVKLTVDTNILISAFVFPGTMVIRLFDDIFDGSVQLGISDEILREFTGICVRKFDYEPEDAVRLSDMIRQAAVMVRPLKTVKVIKDDADNRILECADEFGANMIISGDRHLLELGKYKNIPIITPAEYIRSKP